MCNVSYRQRSIYKYYSIFIDDEWIIHYNNPESSDEIEQTSRKRKGTDDDSIEYGPPRKRKKSPRILDGQYFEIENSDDKNDKISAICKLCGVTKRGSSSGTGNFLRHIRNHHADKSDEVYSYIKTSATETDQNKFSVLISQEKVYVDLHSFFLSNNVQIRIYFSIAVFIFALGFFDKK